MRRRYEFPLWQLQHVAESMGVNPEARVYSRKMLLDLILQKLAPNERDAIAALYIRPKPEEAEEDEELDEDLQELLEEMAIGDQVNASDIKNYKSELQPSAWTR